MAPRSTAPAFTRDSTRALLNRACEVVGFDPEGADLVRLGENAIFALRTAPTVVRIARSEDHWSDAAKEVVVSRWLTQNGVRAGLALDLDQPIDVGGHPVTFWERIDGRGGQPEDVASLGTLLRRVHRLERPTRFDLPDADPLGRVQRRIDYANVPPDDQRFLAARLARIAEELPQLEFPLSPCVVHGDAHVENLMVDDQGAVLIDFERVGWGQPEWDLALTATEYLSAGFWSGAQYGAFVDSYGFDVTSWSGFEALRQTHELKMTSWLMQNVDESSAIRDEYDLRIATMRGRETPRWTPF